MAGQTSDYYVCTKSLKVFSGIPVTAITPVSGVIDHCVTVRPQRFNSHMVVSRIFRTLV